MIEHRYTVQSDHPEAKDWRYPQDKNKGSAIQLAERFNNDGNAVYGPWYILHEQREVTEWIAVEEAT